MHADYSQSAEEGLHIEAGIAAGKAEDGNS